MIFKIVLSLWVSLSGAKELNFKKVGQFPIPGYARESFSSNFQGHFDLGGGAYAIFVGYPSAKQIELVEAKGGGKWQSQNLYLAKEDQVSSWLSQYGSLGEGSFFALTWQGELLLFSRSQKGAWQSQGIGSCPGKDQVGSVGNILVLNEHNLFCKTRGVLFRRKDARTPFHQVQVSNSPSNVIPYDWQYFLSYETKYIYGARFSASRFQLLKVTESGETMKVSQALTFEKDEKGDELFVDDLEVPAPNKLILSVRTNRKNEWNSFPQEIRYYELENGAYAQKQILKNVFRRWREIPEEYGHYYRSSGSYLYRGNFEGVDLQVRDGEFFVQRDLGLLFSRDISKGGVFALERNNELRRLSVGPVFCSNYWRQLLSFDDFGLFECERYEISARRFEANGEMKSFTLYPKPVPRLLGNIVKGLNGRFSVPLLSDDGQSAVIDVWQAK